MSTVKEVTRMSGLISGLDIESLVKAGTMNTKSALEKRQQKLQTLQWKQEAYRDIITTLSDFQKNYLNIESKTSIRANAVMKAKKTTSSNDSLVATASASAADAKYTISSVQTAKSAKLEGSRASSGSVTLDFSAASRGTNSVKVTLDNTTRTITFDGGESAADAKKNFLDELNRSFGEISTAEFSYKDGSNKLTISNDDGVSHIFTVGYNNAVGLKNDASNMISTQSTIGSLDFAEDLEGDEFKFSINGKEFTFDKDTKIKDMMDTINKSKSGVKMSFNSLKQTFELETEATGAGQELTVKQTQGTLVNALFGFSDDELSTGPTTAKLTKQTINNTKFTFSFSANGLKEGDNLYMNGQPLGILNLGETPKKETIKIGTEEISDARVFTDSNGDTIYRYKKEGDTNTYYAKLTSGDAKDGTGVFETQYTVTSGGVVEDADGVALEGKTDSDIIGSYKTVLDPHSEEKIKAAVAEAYTAAYGGDPYENQNKFEVKVSSDGIAKVTFTPAADEAVNVGATGDVGVTKPYLNYEETPYGDDYVLADGPISFKVDGGEEITITGGSDGKVRISDLIAKTSDGKQHFTYEDGVLAAVGKEKIRFVQGADKMSEVFGGKTTVNGIDTVGTITRRGSNSKITINDVTLESAGNDFTVEGTTFNIKDVKEFTAQQVEDGEAEAITVSVSKDTSAIKETVLNFVEEYNKLLDTIHEKLNTKRPKDGSSYYDPLTEDQKDEMEQDEIDKWEEKAKEGWLYNDPTLSRVFTSIRSAVGTAVVDGMTLRDLGLDTGSYEEYGKLKVTDESALEAAIAKYGDEIAKFFTDTKDGLGTKLNNAITQAIDTKTNERGYPKGVLTAMAGMANTRSETKNMIYTQINNMQTIIDKLKERYESEQERLWKRFSALESYIATMNNQSQSLFGTQLSSGQQQ